MANYFCTAINKVFLLGEGELRSAIHPVYILLGKANENFDMVEVRYN